MIAGMARLIARLAGNGNEALRRAAVCLCALALICAGSALPL